MAHFIFYATDAFDDIWRRRQHLSTTLAGLGHRVDYLEPPLRLVDKIKGKSDTSLVKQPGQSVLTHGVTVRRGLHPFPWIGNPFWYGQNLKRDGAMIRALMQGAGKDTVLWLTNPLHGPLARDMKGKAKVVVDLTDRWSAFEGNRHWKDYLDAQHRALISEADFVLAVSSNLLDFAGEVAPKTPRLLLPNGVGPDLFGPLKCPDWFREITSPKAFYAGTLEKRVDFEVLVGLAKGHPGVQFVLCGPLVAHDPNIEALKLLGNVRLTGPKPYPEVLAAMQAADILLLTHKIDPLTQSMHPLKLLEYMAAGPPILSAPVQGTAEVADLLGMYQGPVQAGEVLAALLKHPDPVAREKRREIARAQTWDSRAKEVLAWLNL